MIDPYGQKARESIETKTLTREDPRRGDVGPV